MHGPKKRAGGVAGIEGVRAPARVAQLVADETDHHLLVGKGAQEFARSMGIKIEEGLINETRASSGWNGSAAPIRCTISIRRSDRRPWYEAGLQMVREG
jgi:isoaspartyl peptidase/L-asparaginase-like protein (Ntn-hydrolase superfamily)